MLAYEIFISDAELLVIRQAVEDDTTSLVFEAVMPFTGYSFCMLYYNLANSIYAPDIVESGVLDPRTCGYSSAANYFKEFHYHLAKKMAML